MVIMKKLKNVIIIIVMLMCINKVSLAHGGNITGWKDKNSKSMTKYNEKYYGYHKENGDIAKFKTNEEQITVRFLGINTKETVNPKRGK